MVSGETRDYNKPYLTRTEVAAYLQVSDATIKKLIRQQRLPRVVITGGVHRYRKADLDAAIKAWEAGGLA